MAEIKIDEKHRNYIEIKSKGVMFLIEVQDYDETLVLNISTGKPMKIRPKLESEIFLELEKN